MQIITEDDFRPYQKFIASQRASSSVRLCLGLDDDDVKSECQLRALTALRKFRDGRPNPAQRDYELAYIFTAMKNHVRDLQRKACRQHRQIQPDPTESSPCLDFLITSAVTTTTPFDLVERMQRERNLSLAVTRLHNSVDRETVAVIQGEHEQSDAGYSRRWRARRRARRLLGVSTLSQLESGPEKAKKAKMPFKSAALKDTEHLARVALIHEIPIERYEREYLVTLIDGINDGVDFPSCFATGASGEQEVEFDDTDDACRECGFFAECGACVGGKWTRQEIEEKLVSLKSAAGEAEDAEDGEDGEAGPKKLPPIPAPVKAAAPKKRSPPKRKGPPKKIEDAPTPPQTPAPPKPPKAPKAPKPSKAPKKKTTAPKKKKKPSIHPNHAPLSSRAGVLPPGQTEFKREHFRLPQGSAIAAACLPKGTQASRLWPVNGETKRYYFVVEKIEMGPELINSEDIATRRAGRWQVVSVYQGKFVEKVDDAWALVADAAAMKRHPILGREGTINSIAAAITGGRNWSGARLFGLTAEAAVKKVPALKKKLAASPTSAYVMAK